MVSTGWSFCLQVKTIYKEYIRPKTFHHVPSQPKQENVQIEAPSPCQCNYPICCFRSATRSRSPRGPNRWILFTHSFIHWHSIFINLNCVFAIFPGAGFEDPLTCVSIIDAQETLAETGDPTLLNRIVVWSWISG